MCYIWFEVSTGCHVSLKATVVTWKLDGSNMQGTALLASSVFSPLFPSRVIPNNDGVDTDNLISLVQISLNITTPLFAASTCPVRSPSLCTATATCARAWRSLNISLSSDWVRSTWASPSRAPALCKVGPSVFVTQFPLGLLMALSYISILSALQSSWARMAWTGPSPGRLLRCQTTQLRSS